MEPTTPPLSSTKAIRAWLTAVFAMILAMTLIGGTTRLTGSGLSMVEWRPLMGTLPPMGESEWARVFDQYKTSPQYLQVNTWMELADFQRIFFWEYLHRLFGRTIGLVVFGPWLYFQARRQLSRPMAVRTLAMLVLGGSQGLLGWYMVRSGLVDVPEVSHFRLAAHLLLAFAVAQYVLWVRLDTEPRAVVARLGGLRWATAGLLALTLLQILYGAFMAGTKAGWFSSTFPDINGSWLPGAFIGGGDLVHELLHGLGLIHWTHRTLGWGVLILSAGLAAAMARSPAWRRPAWTLAGLAAAQFTLGALTVVLGVPTPLAVAHQGCALLLLSALTWILHRDLRAVPPAG